MKTKNKYRTTIADHAAAVLRERSETCVGAGDVGLLDLIGQRAGMRYLLPYERRKRILTALGKSKLFVKGAAELNGGRSGRKFTLVSQPSELPSAPAEQQPAQPESAS